MFSARQFARHHKQQTDRAIGSAYARLAANGLAWTAFHDLLQHVRRSGRRLLDAPVVNGCHPGVEALVNLSRFAGAHIRAAADWPGSPASWRAVVSSLAGHLVGKYPVPPILAASWYATDEAYAERSREWFIAHARGASVRSLDLPIDMTRKMEHIFLTSPHHLAIERAMRRAELLALGAADGLVEAVLQTRAAWDFRHGRFWRTVWVFLVANAGRIGLSQVGPLIDFVQTIRHEPIPAATPDGLVLRDPPDPSFSMKGRTARSILRLMQDWHRHLHLASGGLTWVPSRLQPMLLEEPAQDPAAPPVVWHLMELTSSAQLWTEGRAMHHCVATYAERCWRGVSQIWSLRVRRGERVRHLLTIEVDINKRAVVQARGWGNRAASGKPLRFLEDWTARERLRLAI